MSGQNEKAGAGSADEIRRIMSLFGSDRAGALAIVGRLVQERQPPGVILQHLNRFGRPDIVMAFVESLSLDPRTPDLIVLEHARALAMSGASQRGREVLATISAGRSRDYAFQFSAGRLLGEMRMHAAALGHFETAFRVKPTAQAAEWIFSSHLALEQYQEASLAMGRLLRAGSYRSGLGKDFAFLLNQIPPGGLDPELAFALAALPNDDSSIGVALIPHLVAADLLDSILAVLAADTGAELPEHALLAVVPYLAQRGQIEQVLRLHEKHGAASPAVSACFALAQRGMPADQMTQFLLPRVASALNERAAGGEAKAYLDAATRFSATGEPETALAMLSLLPRAIRSDAAASFYTQEKARLARLVSFVIDELGARDDVLDVVAAFLAFWIEPTIRNFFSSPEFADLLDTVAAARRLDDAPAGSRAAHLREEYFAHYLERHTGAAPDSIASDVEFCEAALSYFSAIARQRPVATIPVGTELSARLVRPALSLGQNKPMDTLACYGLLANRPPLSLSQPKAYDEFCWWYLMALGGTGKVPPACLQPAIVAHLGETVAAGDLPGLRTSRFLRLVWSKSDAYRRQFDFSNAIDRVLFVVDMVATVLPSNTQFLPFFHHLFDEGDDRGNLLPRVVALLREGQSPRAPARVRSADAPQDVLLVGHASKDSGLGRNFTMLANALDLDGVKLTGFDYDQSAAAVHDGLDHWHESCASRPIVIFAVNAQDVPDFYIKDRSGTLFDCHTAGFFLWEVSRAADVQKLGAALVDEIWTPTRYVADIYAPFNQTHVIGKGLFHGDEAFLSHSKTERANPAFRFITAFDFDSSIERKNPLAVAQAFRKAFPVGENVELIIKTSNVNPRHWSNSERHWERLLKVTAEDPRIRLVTSRLSNADMEALVRDADCVVSLHRSEGFGYLISDAMAYGTPVIATDYSGNADFCDTSNSWPVPYRLIGAPRDATRWHCDGAEWAEPDVDAAAAQMRHVFESFDDASQKAVRARTNIVEKYSIDAFRAAITARINAIRSGLRQEP
jgi:glycosyltransferase involved in cell wall biosynthesis